jgi:hypothetical protein
MGQKHTKTKRRNMVVVAMIMRSAKAGPHKNHKKEALRRKCRGKVTND